MESIIVIAIIICSIEVFIYLPKFKYRSHYKHFKLFKIIAHGKNKSASAKLGDM